MADAPRKGFWRENLIWILLPFALVAVMVAIAAATLDLSEMFPIFYTPR
jgi:hypothetical protein